MDDDAEAAANSRRQVLEMVAAEQIPIAGFHLPFPAIGHVEPVGKGYHYHPAAYQFNL